MKLFYSPLACSLSPHIVLRELGLPFTLERVDAVTKRTETGGDFLAINPNGYVPALHLDDGEILTEGPAITQYLVDGFRPGTLAPLSGTIERARMNSRLAYIGTELHKPWSQLFDPSLDADARSSTVARLHRRLSYVEQVLADERPYLTGTDFTLPDAYLFVVQNWALMTGVDLAPFPRLLALVDRVAARPAVAAAIEAETRSPAA